jgi:hypothetical protein
MSELDEPGPPERLVIPPEGPFRSLYEQAKAINVEHPSSNLFSNLIMEYLKNATEKVVVLSETPPSHAENRRRIDHSYHMWNPDYDALLPILVKESKAPGQQRQTPLKTSLNRLIRSLFRASSSMTVRMLLVP